MTKGVLVLAYAALVMSPRNRRLTTGVLAAPPCPTKPAHLDKPDVLTHERH